MKELPAGASGKAQDILLRTFHISNNLPILEAALQSQYYN